MAEDRVLETQPLFRRSHRLAGESLTFKVYPPFYIFNIWIILLISKLFHILNSGGEDRSRSCMAISDHSLSGRIRLPIPALLLKYILVTLERLELSTTTSLALRVLPIAPQGHIKSGRRDRA